MLLTSFIRPLRSFLGSRPVSMRIGRRLLLELLALRGGVLVLLDN